MKNNSKNNIETLRKHLFETLDALKDKDNPMEIERAKAISEVSQVIINSAKVEAQYAHATGAKTTGFLEEADTASDMPPGITGVRVHKLK